MLTTTDLVSPGRGVPPAPRAAAAGRPSLHWVGAGHAERPRRSFRLDADEITVGRAAESDVVVDDLGASRHHCRIVRGADGEWLLLDSGSRNGTYVNGVNVRAQPLREGDKIQLGSGTALRFSFRTQPDERKEWLARAMRGVSAFQLNAACR